MAREKKQNSKVAVNKKLSEKKAETLNCNSINKNMALNNKSVKKIKKAKKIKVLFVCTGNTCRSPMIEQLFKRYLRQKKELSLFEVSSAGIFVDSGAKMNAYAEKALTILGLKPYSHASRQLTETMAEGADIIICMTASHKAAIDGHKAIFSLGELTGANDAPDPYGGDLDMYLAVAKYLDYACADIYKAACACR